MELKSEERSTGRGANRYTALLTARRFVPLSKIEQARYLGRFNGEEHYALKVDDNTIYGNFYRSNSGKEEVSIYQGEELLASFRSFSEAQRWAENK